MGDAEEVAAEREVNQPVPSPWPSGTAHTGIQAAGNGGEGPCRLAGTCLVARSSARPCGTSLHAGGQ